MSNATNNGTQRKQLSDQLDRLDHILDGLSEALNESVADAVRGVISLAVSQAVHAAVKEVLSSPDLLRAALATHSPPDKEMPPLSIKENVPGIISKLREKLKRAASFASKKLTESVKQACKIMTNAPTIIKMLANAAWAFRKPCAVAVGVGVLCAATCYFGGQVFSSAVNGLGGAALTLPVRRLFFGGYRNT